MATRYCAGSVLAPAFDVMDAGRLGVAAEPSGAVVCFWQAGAHIGAGVVDEPGAYCWADLVTPDPKGAVEFFTEVVGMGHGTHEMPGLGSVDFLKVGDDDVAAIVLPPAEGIPPHWQTNFAVADCDAASDQIKELGGEIIVEPFDMALPQFRLHADGFLQRALRGADHFDRVLGQLMEIVERLLDLEKIVREPVG